MEADIKVGELNTCSYCGEVKVTAALDADKLPVCKICLLKYPIKTEPIDYQNPICPECNSNRISYNAIRMFETHIEQFLYTCSKCGCQFGKLSEEKL